MISFTSIEEYGQCVSSAASEQKSNAD